MTLDAKTWAQQVWPKIEAKVAAECERWGAKIPYIARNGRYTDMWEKDPAWWTNGFWPGILWLLYHQTHDKKYLAAARGVEEKFDSLFDEYNGLHHDVGFMWMNSAVMDFSITGNERSKIRGLHAASLLAGRYNPRGRFIRAWNEDRVGWIIIDCMMNLALLYWAGEASGDPRFKFIAMDHADTALSKLLRDDGSSNHIAVLDPETGELLETPAGQGCAPGSAWTRGQAWALYGFAISAAHTGEERYLAASKRAASYFIAQVQAHGWTPPIDFRGPEEMAPVKDASAGVIAASGLLQLAEETGVGDGEQNFYRDAALCILRAAEENYCDWDPARDAIVQEGAVAYHAKDDGYHVPLIYADYFFIEAVHRLLNPGFRVW